jgi:anti-sigma regulatory factor (Ser/Thr protein kinase)
MEQSNLFNTDIQLARKMQSLMLPQQLPRIHGLDIQTYFQPCSSHGGDLYDIIQISENIMAVLIFDVSGHEVASTLISGMTKICFLKHLKSTDSPRAILGRINEDLLREIPANFFVTAFLGLLDLHDHKFTYSNAGHIWPIVFRKKEKTIIPLITQGTFLGVFNNGFYNDQSIFLSPEDTLLLFTDGIYQLYTIQECNARTSFEMHISEILCNNSHKKLFRTINDRYCKMIETILPDDDITAISIEILAHSRKNQLKEKLGFYVNDPVYLQSINYFEEMDKAIGIILGALDTYGYPDETIRKMKITLTELLVNAILHGNGRDFSKTVFIGHIVNKNMAAISIMDEGNGFDPSSVPDPTLLENLIKDCGRGLFLVKHYVDEITYNQTGNRITIIKKYESLTTKSDI